MITLNPIQVLEAMGKAHYRRSSHALGKVIDALREDVKLYDMAVDSGDGKRVPLEQYLSTMMQITEADEFFTGAPIFDIWRTLPLGLRSYPGNIGVSLEEAPKLLERFDAYTWNEYTPELREQYMWALKKSLWVADENEFIGWRAHNGTPNLSATLDMINESPEFAELRSIYDLKQATEEVRKIEGEVGQIPPERMLDRFTRRGRGRIEKRNRMIRELEIPLKRKAEEVIGPLTELGNEYRHLHVEEYYPEMR